MPIEDIEMVRYVRREMARRCLDTGQVTVSAMRGVIHLHGTVRPLRGHEGEFEEEINVLHRVLKQRAGVRDVVMEWNEEGQGPKKTSRERS